MQCPSPYQIDCEITGHLVSKTVCGKGVSFTSLSCGNKARTDLEAVTRPDKNLSHVVGKLKGDRRSERKSEVLWQLRKYDRP